MNHVEIIKSNRIRNISPFIQGETQVMRWKVNASLNYGGHDAYKAFSDEKTGHWWEHLDWLIDTRGNSQSKLHRLLILLSSVNSGILACVREFVSSDSSGWRVFGLDSEESIIQGKKFSASQHWKFSDVRGFITSIMHVSSLSSPCTERNHHLSSVLVDPEPVSHWVSICLVLLKRGNKNDMRIH